jgi:hypothetical protein
VVLEDGLRGNAAEQFLKIKNARVAKESHKITKGDSCSRLYQYIKLLGYRVQAFFSVQTRK